MNDLLINSNLPLAIEHWEDLLGRDAVETNASSLEALGRTTFKLFNPPSVALYPKTREQVGEILKIAAEYRIPVYPISRGRNWGLGSKLSTAKDCALIDLSGLNRILDYNEELSFLTVEPGVTFAAASQFLKDKGSKHFLSVIGGPPDASIIGNVLERGEGLGPLGERSISVCAIHALLADGTVIKTGFSDALNSKVHNLHRSGIGAAADGLFFQSNLGVVVQLTIWLQANPKSFQAFCVSCSNEKERFTAFVTSFRELHEQGIVKPCSLALWNSYKFLASTESYPWQGGDVVKPENLLSYLHPRWSKTGWFGFGALYGGSKAHARADKKELKRALKGKAQKILVVDSFTAWLAEKFGKYLKGVVGVDMVTTVRSLYSKSLFLGNPSVLSLKSVYWRKKGPLPENFDPDRDRCGVIWLCHAVPFRGEDILEAEKLVQEHAFEYGFEPNIALVNISERVLHLFVAIMFDRDISGEDERAIACHDRLFKALNSVGFTAYRLGIQSQHLYGEVIGERIIVKKLREIIDPGQIISRGRYDC